MSAKKFGLAEESRPPSNYTSTTSLATPLHHLERLFQLFDYHPPFSSTSRPEMKALSVSSETRTAESVMDSIVDVATEAMASVSSVDEDDAEKYELAAFIFCANATMPGVDVRNVTVESVGDWGAFLKCLLGPSRLPMTTLAPITVVYCILLVTGVIGNFFTCFVIAKKRYMHNATNFYLLNLSIADLISSCVGENYRILSKFIIRTYPS